MSSTRSRSFRARSRNTFTNIFQSSAVGPEVPEVPFPLLELPRPIRVKIWRKLGFSYTKTLRLVCSLFKEDIDKFTGISSAIDSTYDDFPFHCNIAIRKVAIHELTIPNYIEFLKYPHILEELEIRGEITLQTFQYILKSCPNISKLFITFNKFVLDYKTPFFPLPPLDLVNPKPLSKLRSIKLISNTKNLIEMQYIYRIFISLLRDTLPDVKIDYLHIWVTHKCSSTYFREIVWSTLVFVHKHASTLKYLSLTFRDRDQAAIAGPVGNGKANEQLKKENKSDAPANASVASPQSQQNENATTATADKSKQGNAQNASKSNDGKKAEMSKKVEQQPSNSRRDTAAIPLLPGVVITHHVKDIHSEDANAAAAATSPEGEGEADVEVSKSEETIEERETNAGIAEATQYLSNNEWPPADNLEQLWLTSSLNYMEHVVKMLSPKTRLHILQLETVGGGEIQSNWNFYKEFITRCDPRRLKFASFFGVSHVNSMGGSLPIDLGIFKKCVSLRKLSIFCQRREDFSKLSCAKGISKLPDRLAEINIERMLLTWWQLTRLILCFDEMNHVSVAYWSINDCQFALLMKILKWCIRLEFTDVHQICLVDTKLRFKSKRQAVRNLQQAVAISARYQDLDETRLVIDVSQRRDEMSFAPRISLHKVITSSRQKSGKRRKGKANKAADDVSLSSQMSS